jgi:acetyl esterase
MGGRKVIKTGLDLRVRLLGRALQITSAARLTEDGIARAQNRKVPRNRVTDYLLGGLARGVTIQDGSFSTNESHIPIRVYRPAGTSEALPIVVSYHGGGWVLGSLDQSDWVCSNIARLVGAAVVSVGYRLAPAHRWPAAVEDCYAGLVHCVTDAASIGGDPSRVAVMGESAGGNLAAVVAMLARDRSGPTICSQALLYPITDATLSSESIEENAHAPILTKRELIIYRDHYLGGQDPSHPYVSPLLADDLSGLPPAAVQVGKHDPLRDDGIRYAQALHAAGIAATVRIYPRMPHGYMSFPRICRDATWALEELGADLSRALGTPTNENSSSVAGK